MERETSADQIQNLRSVLDQQPGFECIVGRSRRLLQVLEMALRVAQHDSTVLIQGETGTGKELLAKAIHYNSRGKDQPFITINCGAIGSFSGKLEMANGGTLFLDEIGELPPEMQIELSQLWRRGAMASLRVIAATNRNLSSMKDGGAFREDLYYRLAVVPLELPPLRERKEDLPELIQHLFGKLKDRHGLTTAHVSPEVMTYLSSHRWPGNVRELENVLERMLVLSFREEITEADLPDEIRRAPVSKESLLANLPEQGISLESVERELLIKALERFSGNQTQAARYLDISRRTLIYRMEKHGLRGADEPVPDCER